MLHSLLQPFLIDTEHVHIGPMFTQPHRESFFLQEQGETTCCYVDIGSIRDWQDGTCGDEYAEGVRNLLTSYDGKLLVDSANNGLVVELTVKAEVNIRDLVNDFMREYNGLFE